MGDIGPRPHQNACVPPATKRNPSRTRIDKYLQPRAAPARQHTTATPQRPGADKSHFPRHGADFRVTAFDGPGSDCAAFFCNRRGLQKSRDPAPSCSRYPLLLGTSAGHVESRRAGALRNALFPPPARWRAVGRRGQGGPNPGECVSGVRVSAALGCPCSTTRVRRGTRRRIGGGPGAQKAAFRFEHFEER